MLVLVAISSWTYGITLLLACLSFCRSRGQIPDFESDLITK